MTQPSSRLRLCVFLAIASSLLMASSSKAGVVVAYSNPPIINPLSARATGEKAKPKLILIAGAPGTGKSTFGMSVALDQGILKCISTDTVRAVMRSFVSEGISPALHRSSYAPAYDDGYGDNDDPVRSWRETCSVLQRSVESLVDDAIRMGRCETGLVVEGVHIVPGPRLIRKWEEAGGVAVGCLLQVSDPENHKRVLKKGGYISSSEKDGDMRSFDRVRAIQEEMMRLADEAGWLRIEQRTEPDPLEMVKGRLTASSEAKAKASAPVDITQDIFRAAQVPLIELARGVPTIEHYPFPQPVKEVPLARKKARTQHKARSKQATVAVKGRRKRLWN